MKFNIKTLQLGLVSFGVILILGTYFLYPNLKKEKNKTTIDEFRNTQSEDNTVLGGKKGNVFENVEYKGSYNVNNSFNIKSKKAHIFESEPDIVHMEDMYVTLYMNSGKIVTIRSDEGTYNKLNYNCFFKKNVKTTDGETILLSRNLDLISDENYASAYNDVILTSDQGSLIADKVRYNFETEIYNITMFDDKRVKVKLFK